MSNPPIALASKKTETYYIWLPVHELETHLINFLLKSQPNTPPSPIYLVPDTTSKLPSFCFLWEEVRKKCAEVLFFLPDKIYSMSGMHTGIIIFKPNSFKYF